MNSMSSDVWREVFSICHPGVVTVGIQLRDAMVGP